jgi:hypothetical protein
LKFCKEAQIIELLQIKRPMTSTDSTKHKTENTQEIRTKDCPIQIMILSPGFT